MFFRVFTLHPDIFDSFLRNSLIARGIEKNVIEVDLVNWREKFGVGNYRQVDDKPFGGGAGMVLQAEPIFQALREFDAVSTLFNPPEKEVEHDRILPNNSAFYKKSIDNREIRKCTVSLTPRGFSLNQKIVEWLSGFEEINILSGRYEGFDARVSEAVDLEISVGDYVLNGGEVGAMALIESISRLVPEFISKSESVAHDSFSSELNYYREQREFVVGKNNLKNGKIENINSDYKKENLFNNQDWLKNILPKIEHPQYSRPEIWNNWKVPEVLLSGNHKKIQDWRKKWY